MPRRFIIFGKGAVGMATHSVQWGRSKKVIPGLRLFRVKPGKIGRKPRKCVVPPEHLANDLVLCFKNVKSLDVLIENLQNIRKNMTTTLYKCSITIKETK